MKIQYSASADPKAVGKAPNHLNQWTTAESSIEDLVQFAYVQHRAICGGVFDLDAPLQGEERSHKIARLWRGSMLVILDVDHADGWTLDQFKALDYIQTYAAAVIPSSSHTPDEMKAHAFFILPEQITNAEQYKQLAEGIAAHLPMVVCRSTLSPYQAVYGTLYNAPSMQGHVNSLEDGLVWINPSPQLINVPTILAERIATGKWQPESLNDVSGQAYDSGERDLPVRVQKHLAASPERQTAITLEALEYALRGNWGSRDRAGRLPLLMSAYTGSNDTRVRDAFLNHSGDAWDESDQKAQLGRWWATHVPRKNGYTVATLFNEARKHGWLQRSSAELQAYEEIYSDDLTQWMQQENLPTRILLKSPTGTGKTVGAIALLKHLRVKEERPIKALFFSPSIKLCLALSAELTQVEVENVCYIDGSRKTKDAKTLIDAQVLVTTLQTFATKAFASGVDIKSYDLVVMDESDELLGAFVKSGIGGKLAAASHVDGTQARLGMDSISALFQQAKRILLLDGTATELSRYILQAFSPPNSTGVYVNTYTRPKADVTLYYQLPALREDIITQVKAGKRVVVACDTKAEANLIETLLLLTDSVQREAMIRITGDTAADHRVYEFFKDVELGARSYQVVIYNSAMGSGVSITETRPDVLYLIATYLHPRKLIQMLNRYRDQGIVRAHVQVRESLYTASVAERYVQMQNVVKIESALSGLTLVDKSDTAKIVTNAALIVATDEYDQLRSVKDFFVALLKEDGRKVHYHWAETFAYEEEEKQAREVVKGMNEEIKTNWRSVPPIHRGDPFPKDLTSDEAAKGLLHGMIEETFPGCEAGALGLEDREIADLALTFSKRRGLIKRWLMPESIMSSTLEELQNGRKETVAFRLYFARVELITLLNLLVPDSDKPCTDEELSIRASLFNAEVRQRRAAYDMIAPAHHQMAEVEAMDKDARETALIFANVLMKSVGLKFRRKNGKRRADGTRERLSYVDGIDRLHQYATLARLPFDRQQVKNFNRKTFSNTVSAVRRASVDYLKLPSGERQEVLKTLTAIDGVDYPSVISAVHSRSFAS